MSAIATPVEVTGRPVQLQGSTLARGLLRLGGWQVRFGPPLRWSHRPELHDYQLGLMMAAVLPDDLAAAWRDDLHRWRAAHGLGDET